MQFCLLVILANGEFERLASPFVPFVSCLLSLTRPPLLVRQTLSGKQDTLRVQSLAGVRVVVLFVLEACVGEDSVNRKLVPHKMLPKERNGARKYP